MNNAIFNPKKFLANRNDANDYNTIVNKLLSEECIKICSTLTDNRIVIRYETWFKLNHLYTVEVYANGKAILFKEIEINEL